MTLVKDRVLPININRNPIDTCTGIVLGLGSKEVWNNELSCSPNAIPAPSLRPSLGL